MQRVLARHQQSGELSRMSNLYEYGGIIDDYQLFVSFGSWGPGSDRGPIGFPRNVLKMASKRLVT